jgi:hypothetical protein
MRAEQHGQTRMLPIGAGVKVAPEVPPAGVRPDVARNSLDATPVSVPSLLRAAVIDLGSFFEEERVCMNDQLARQGRPEWITVTQHGIERRYSFYEGMSERYVSLFTCVPARDGHVFGGAFVRTSKTPPYVYLLPQIVGARARWIVTATRSAFNRMVVLDFFSAAFVDDAEAVARIAPLVGFDLFQMPWS